MAQENVVVARFMDPSNAYQALSVLKDCDAEGRIGLESAAVVRYPHKPRKDVCTFIPMRQMARVASVTL